MLSDALFIQQSLINNLFYLRTIREFCLTIQLSFYENNRSYSEVAEGLRKRYEELEQQAINLAKNRLPQEIINSDSFVTNYTLDCELLTEKLFGIDINTDLTTQAMNLIVGTEKTVNQEIISELSALNENAIELTQNFIDFARYLLKGIKNTTIFSYSYPLIYIYMIEEASLYVNDLYRIQNRTGADPTFVVSYEYWFSNSMKQASQFIMGLSDPDQSAIITNADNYRKIFSEQMKKYQGNITPDIQKLLNEQTIQHVDNFISFLTKIITGILNQELYFIAPPIFFDNLLTESYYFRYLLKGAQFGIQ